MIDWWVNQMLELFPTFLHLNISWLLCILNRDSSDGGYIFVSIVESSQPLSPLQLLKLIVGFVGDRPIALFPFFLISYLFESWLLHVCSWFGKDGMKKVRFHASSSWKMEKYDELTSFWPTNTPTSSRLQKRRKEWETRVGRVENGPARLPGSQEFGDVGHLSPQSLGKENLVAFPSHVDRSIDSTACICKENCAHLR